MRGVEATVIFERILMAQYMSKELQASSGCKLRRCEDMTAMGIGKMLEMGVGTWFRIVLKNAVVKRRFYTENLAKNSKVQGIKAG